MAKIRRAIMSCHDKAGVADFARVLRDLGVEIIATEGTRKTLADAGIEAERLADFTGVREMLNGRVKSLHPKVHAGLLAIRDNKLHNEEMQTYGYEWIDLVVVNLHPIDTLIAKTGISPDEVMQQIDIGGMSMIRSAAKNYSYVAVVVNPQRYLTLAHELKAHEGELPFTSRFKLAQEAFETTAKYDQMLAAYLKRHEPEEE